MQDTAARVLSCETMAQDLVRIILSAPDIAAQAKAGQFIHILVPDSGHVLRRPISLMAADAAAGTLTLAIQPKGAGTQTLCACKPGETIRVLGPLGTGFDGKGAQCVYFVGGGVGVGDVLDGREQGLNLAVIHGGQARLDALEEVVVADLPRGIDPRVGQVGETAHPGLVGHLFEITEVGLGRVGEDLDDLVLAGAHLGAVQAAVL